MVRVAVLQIPSTPPLESALASCVRETDRAVTHHQARVVVCPAFSLVASEPSAAQQIETIRGTLAERARAHAIWIALSVTSAEGSFVGWLTPEEGEQGSETGERLVATPFGKLAICSERELLEPAATRALALDGATLICAPVGVCSAAEIGLHLPARAAESGLFVALAALFELVSEPYPSSAITLPPDDFGASPRVRGATSQIVGSDGRPLAIAVVDEEGLAVAELDLSEPVRRSVGDATPLLSLRRPELYRRGPRRARDQPAAPAAVELQVATVDVPFRGATHDAVSAASTHVEALAQQGVELLVLPELFCFESLPEDPEAAANDFALVVRALAQACRHTRAHVVTSLVERVGSDFSHVGVLVGQAGVVARQPQLHVPPRHGWARAGHGLVGIPMPWGNLAITVGEDALVPELSASYALLGTDIIAAPLSARYQAEATLSLPALADQLQLAAVAALRGEHEPDASTGASSFIVDPGRWPALRALGEQELLQSCVGLRALREARAKLPSASSRGAA